MQTRKKYQIYLLVALIVACVVYLMLAPRKIGPRDYPEIAGEGTLRFTVGYGPSDYFLQGDTVSGFEYELACMVGRESGLKTEIYPETSLAGSLHGLAVNRYDIVARAIPLTVPGKEEYRFSRPLLQSREVLVQRCDSSGGRNPIRNQLDLAGRTLYIPAGSPAALRIRNLSHEIGDTIYVCEEPLYSDEQLIMMVARGEIDLAVCAEDAVRTLAPQYPQIDYGTDIGFTQLTSWAVRNTSPSLADSLDVWLRRIEDKGEMDRLVGRYFR